MALTNQRPGSNPLIDIGNRGQRRNYFRFSRKYGVIKLYALANLMYARIL